jgi:hypothetical protein
MGEDIALFDAAFFNQAADVASVSPLWPQRRLFCSRGIRNLTCFLRDWILRLDFCLRLSTKLPKTASPLILVFIPPRTPTDLEHSRHPH